MASEVNLISLDEARRKCDERNSSFVRVESVEHICLAPSYLGRVKVGIEAQLDKRLMKFSEKLQCVPVAYEGLQLLRRHGTVVEESPFIHVDVKVCFIVFKPTIGSILIGTVNKLDFDHIGCLVHHCFNASIAIRDNANGLFFRDLELENEFEFRVVGFEAVNGVFFVFGSIDDECHKRNRKRHRNTVRSSRHHLQSNGEFPAPSETVVMKQEVDEEPETTPKKKPKTKSKSKDYSEIDDEPNKKSTGKSDGKKKKRKKKM